MKTLDTRDLYKRKCELEDLRDTLNSAREELKEAEAELEAHNASSRADLDEETWDEQQENLEEAVSSAEDNVASAESDFGTDEQEELTELEELESNMDARSFRDGETMIPERDFREYAEQLAEECGDYDSRAAKWPLTCIDWEQAAEELKQDYTRVTYQGTEYLVRA